MSTSVPSTDQVAARLSPLRTRELRELAAQSGVPYRTLLKIRTGETPNPGIETVRKFFSLLPAPAANDAQTPVTDTASQGVANV